MPARKASQKAALPYSSRFPLIELLELETKQRIARRPTAQPPLRDVLAIHMYVCAAAAAAASGSTLFVLCAGKCASARECWLLCILLFARRSLLLRVLLPCVAVVAFFSLCCFPVMRRETASRRGGAYFPA